MGPTGPTGPAGKDAESCCICINQMRNIIEQIITLYPNDDLFISLESGNNVSGRPGMLIPGPNSNPNSGLFKVINNVGTLEETVSLSKIVSIRITSAAYNDEITYLPISDETSNGCDCVCENAIKTLLPENTCCVSIKAGGQTIAQGTVKKSEYGMIVIVDNNDNNPTFISTCNIEVISK